MEAVEALAVCINSAKTGFYLRVLNEGIIRAGDAIELEFSNDSAPTVEEVHILYYLDKNNIDGLRYASRCKSLTRVFRDEFRSRIAKLEMRH